MICGDFNNDKPVFKHLKMVNQSDCTFRRIVNNKEIKSKTDHIYISKKLIQQVTTKWTVLSDHCLIAT